MARKTAVAVYVLRIIAAILITFSIKKSSFVSCNSACYSVCSSDATDTKETFICSSIWLYMENHALRLRPKHGLNILLILAGDVEICPGPAKKCYSYQKTISKNQIQLSCDSCKGHLHSKCLMDKFNCRGESYYCKNCETGSIADVYDDFDHDADPRTYNRPILNKT